MTLQDLKLERLKAMSRVKIVVRLYELPCLLENYFKFKGKKMLIRLRKHLLDQKNDEFGSQTRTQTHQT